MPVVGHVVSRQETRVDIAFWKFESPDGSPDVNVNETQKPQGRKRLGQRSRGRGRAQQTYSLLQGSRGPGQTAPTCTELLQRISGFVIAANRGVLHGQGNDTLTYA